MSELFSVVQNARRLRASGEPFLLATLVRVTGSSYRRAGARLLLAEAGPLHGSVSAGCLEEELHRRGSFHTATSPVVLVTYDSRSDEAEGGFGEGFGCNGVLDILLERSDAPALVESLDWIATSLEAEEITGLATVFRSTTRSVAVGTRVWAARGQLHSTPHSEVAERTLGPLTFATLERGSHESLTLDCAGGELDVLFETLRPPPHLFLCGDRADAVPVAELARLLGWKTTIWSSHARPSARERFSGLAEFRTGSEKELVEYVGRAARPLAVLMTHDYDADQRLLEALLPSRAIYIGVLGPRRRTARLLEGIEKGSAKLSARELRRLHAPVGLAIGAETPAEIALSIVAEIQCRLSSADGGHLNEREGPIHSAPLDPPVAWAKGAE
jgi:xanthine/CO dehydrogenase XdhC/CoxF family maturation factor